MKKIIPICILVLMMISCQNQTKQLELTKNELKTNYQTSSSVDDAVKLAEFYNLKYTLKQEQIEEGLKDIALFKSLYPDELKLHILEANLYTVLGGAYAKKMDLEKAMRNITKGFDGMDELLNQYPDNSYFLIYRGINSVSVPKMFNRLQYALSDLKKLIDMENTPDQIRILAYTNYAKALKMNKDKNGLKKLKGEFATQYPHLKLK